jgi:hypothetical protein
MPRVPFESLPDSARVWVFASDRPLTDARAERLLMEVEGYLHQWQAHGRPLRSGADWRENRFLTVAVDQTEAHASGCSIDGLHRTLRTLEPVLGTELLNHGHVFYRAATGEVAVAARDEFAALAAAGAVHDRTPVFDTTVTTLGDWRARFETELKKSWHKRLLTE